LLGEGKVRKDNAANTLRCTAKKLERRKMSAAYEKGKGGLPNEKLRLSEGGRFEFGPIRTGKGVAQAYSQQCTERGRGIGKTESTGFQEGVSSEFGRDQR